MKKIRSVSLFALALLVLVFSSAASDLITVTVTLTNNPSGNTNTITVNGATRMWTNSISASPNTLILQTNSVVNATTNLLNHFSAYSPGLGFIVTNTTASNVIIKGIPGKSVTVTIAGLWASVSYLTNAVTDATAVRVPISVETGTNQTNIASLLVSALNLSTNSLATNATAMSNFLSKGASPRQTIPSPVTFYNVSGTNGGLTNGIISGAVLVGTVATGFVNYGSALRSEGSGGNSLQVGSNAVSSGSLSMAIGNSAVASSSSATAIGIGATASDQQTVALGTGANAYGVLGTALGAYSTANTNSVAVGNGSSATLAGIAMGQDATADGQFANAIGNNSGASAHSSSAFGAFSAATYSNSTAIGYNSATTTTNQIMIGTSSDTVRIPGGLQVVGNSFGLTLTGTNRLSGIPVRALETITSVAAGANRIYATNAGVRVTGTPGASWSVVSLAGVGIDGQEFEVYNDTGYTVTIANESGSEATASYRIRTMRGADYAGGTNGVYTFRYDGNRSRWVLRSVNP